MRASFAIVASMLLLGAAPAAAAPQPADPAAAVAMLKQFLATPGAVWKLVPAVLGVVVLSFLFYAWALRLACRICGSDVTIGQAFAAVVVQLVVGVCVGVLELAGFALLGFGPAQGLEFQGAQMGISLLANAFVIERMGMSESFIRAIAVCVFAPLITAAVSVAVALAGMFAFGLLAA